MCVGQRVAVRVEYAVIAIAPQGTGMLGNGAQSPGHHLSRRCAELFDGKNGIGGPLARRAAVASTWQKEEKLAFRSTFYGTKRPRFVSIACVPPPRRAAGIP